jgi:hydrogenase maturation protease
MNHIVIGIGNTLRGDDGCGPLVVRLLQRRLNRCRFYSVTENTLSIIDLWDSRSHVYLIDAIVSGNEPGTIHRIDLSGNIAEIRTPVVSGHTVSPIDALRFAELLSQKPERCILYAIEAKSFRMGSSISSVIKRASYRVASRILKEISDGHPSLKQDQATQASAPSPLPVA